MDSQSLQSSNNKTSIAPKSSAERAQRRKVCHNASQQEGAGAGAGKPGQIGEISAYV